MQEEPPYPAIIVLAHHMDERGSLSNISRGRMDRAVAAFRAGEAPLIVTTGWAYRQDVPIPIAEVMRDYAIQQHHIPPEVIITDTHARDTVGDAVFIKQNLAKPRGWKCLLVVTSDYHARRTREIFSFIYGPGYQIDMRDAPVKAGKQQALSEEESLRAFRDTFQGIAPGDDEAILARLRTRHPFYNGEGHPKI